MTRHLAWLCLFVCVKASAGDLSRALDAASQYDAPWRAAQAAFRSASEEEPIALSGLLPNISGNVSTSHASTTDMYTGQPAHGHASSTALSLHQPVVNVQNILDWRTAKISVNQARDQLDLARQDLILRLAQAWFACLKAEDALSIVRTQKQAVADELTAAQRRFELGAGTVTDRDDARARYDQVAAQEIAAWNDLTNARRALLRITGQPIEPRQVLGQPLNLGRLEPGQLTDWLGRAEAKSYKIQSARAAVHIADLKHDRALAGHLPTLDLVGSWTENHGVGSIYGRDQSIGLQLNIPLFAGGGTQAQVRRAAADEEKSQADADDVRRGVDVDVQTAYFGVQTALAQARAYQQAVYSGYTNLQSLRSSVRLGVRTTTDLLDAENRYYGALRDLAGARYDALQHDLELKAAAGVLTDADVQQVDAILEPQN